MTTDNEGRAVIRSRITQSCGRPSPSGMSGANCATSIAELFRWHSSGQASRWPEKGRQKAAKDRSDAQALSGLEPETSMTSCVSAGSVTH